MERLIGLKTKNLEILNIENGIAHFIYFGNEYHGKVEYHEEYDYWFLPLPNGDGVCINNKLI